MWNSCISLQPPYTLILTHGSTPVENRTQSFLECCRSSGSIERNFKTIEVVLHFKIFIYVHKMKSRRTSIYVYVFKCILRLLLLDFLTLVAIYAYIHWLPNVTDESSALIQTLPTFISHTSNIHSCLLICKRSYLSCWLDECSVFILSQMYKCRQWLSRVTKLLFCTCPCSLTKLIVLMGFSLFVCLFS